MFKTHKFKNCNPLKMNELDVISYSQTSTRTTVNDWGKGPEGYHGIYPYLFPYIIDSLQIYFMFHFKI